jgi:hypothetical protein
VGNFKGEGVFPICRVFGQDVHKTIVEKINGTLAGMNSKFDRQKVFDIFFSREKMFLQERFINK